MSERLLHCWEDGPSREIIVDEDGREYETANAPPEVFEGQWWGRLRSESSTCMLPAGHEGPHEWTPDDQIEIAFL